MYTIKKKYIYTKTQTNVILHEFQLSEILTRADFYRDARIINPSIKPSITACTDIDSAWPLIHQLCPQRYARSSTI